MRFVHAAVMVDPDELIVEEKWGLHVQILEAPLPFVSEEYGCYALFVREDWWGECRSARVLDPPGISGCERADESEELELPDLGRQKNLFSEFSFFPSSLCGFPLSVVKKYYHREGKPQRERGVYPFHLNRTQENRI